MGILPSLEEVEAARSVVAGDGLSNLIELRLGTASETGLTSKSQDRVYCNEVLHCVGFDAINIALRELFRITRPGGMLYVGSLPDRDEHAAGNQDLGPIQYFLAALKGDDCPYSLPKLSALTVRYLLTGKGYVIRQATPYFSTPNDFKQALERHGYVGIKCWQLAPGSRWNYKAQRPFH